MAAACRSASSSTRTRGVGPEVVTLQMTGEANSRRLLLPVAAGLTPVPTSTAVALEEPEEAYMMVLHYCFHMKGSWGTQG